MEDKGDIEQGWIGMYDPRRCLGLQPEEMRKLWWMVIIHSSRITPFTELLFDHGPFRMFNWIPDDKDIRFRQGIVEHYSEIRHIPARWWLLTRGLPSVADCSKRELAE